VPHLVAGSLSISSVARLTATDGALQFVAGCELNLTQATQGLVCRAGRGCIRTDTTGNDSKNEHEGALYNRLAIGAVVGVVSSLAFDQLGVGMR
jgi:hypothetical protein